MSEQELGVKVKLLTSFAVVKETLERMGIVNWEKHKIFPSCYLVEDDEGQFKIYHFKELFEKEGKKSDFFDEDNDKDLYRRNTIIYNLKNWELIELEEEINGILVEKIDVVKFKDKKNYRICHKYLFKRNIDF